MQIEIDQLTITSNPGDVGEQCSQTSRDADMYQERHQRARRDHELEDDEGQYHYNAGNTFPSLRRIS